MKSWLSTAAVALMMAAIATTTTAAAQEMSFRSGVVTGIAPVQVAASQTISSNSAPSQTGGALGRAMGRFAGRAAARIGGEYSYDAASIASGATQDTLASANTRAPAAGGATTTAYMVMIRFDDGQESAIQIADASNLKSGGRVRVFGSGSAAQIVPQ